MKSVLGLSHGGNSYQTLSSPIRAKTKGFVSGDGSKYGGLCKPFTPAMMLMSLLPIDTHKIMRYNYC